MRDTGIADRIRAEGVKVIEVDGWRIRGKDTLVPRGSVNHHTAGGRTGNAPSLGICINGRSDLPGPLCNVLQGRDNTAYVIAAGKANHAGLGGWKGLSGNSSVYGLEVENVGTTAEPWRADQIDTMVRIHVALIKGTPRPSAELVCQHKEWAPTRKSDAHTIVGATFRGLIADRLYGTKPNPLLMKEHDMFYVIGYEGAGGLWFYFPQANKKGVFSSQAHYDDAIKAPGFGGHITMVKPQVDAIPNFDPNER